MDNKYMDEEELAGIFPASDDCLLFEQDLPQLISDRIKIITFQFALETILINFNGEVASIVASTPAGDQSAKFATDIIMNESIDNSLTNVPTAIFYIDHESEINYRMFKDPNQNVALSKFSTNIGNIDISIYARSQIMEEDEG